MAIKLDYQRGYVGKRFRHLKEAGLLATPDEDDLPNDVAPRGLAHLTDLGERFMNDELTDDEAEQLEGIGESG